jgi:hypothetical protein
MVVRTLTNQPLVNCSLVLFLTTPAYSDTRCGALILSTLAYTLDGACCYPPPPTPLHSSSSTITRSSCCGRH